MREREQVERGGGEDGTDGKRRKGLTFTFLEIIRDVSDLTFAYFFRFGRTHQSSCWINTKTRNGTNCEENFILKYC